MHIVLAILILAVAVVGPVGVARAAIRRASASDAPAFDEGSEGHSAENNPASWHRLRNIMTAVTFPLSVLLWWLAGYSVGRAVTRAIPTDAFKLVPPMWMWLPSALAIGMAMSMEVVDLALRQILTKMEYDGLIGYERTLSSVNRPAVLHALCVTAFAIGISVLTLLSDCYAYTTTSEFVVNRFWALGERRYAYHDIVAIRTAPTFVAPNGNRVRRRIYVVRFADGTSWTTNDDPSASAPALMVTLVESIAARSSIELTELPLLQRSDL